MFRTIMLPVDLTDRHGPALRIAGELCTQSKGTIILLHVIETIAGLSLEEERDFYNRLEETARIHLHRLGMQLETKHVPWKAEIAYGYRTAESVRHATEVGADLIIVSTPKIDPAHPTEGWGSLGYKIGILSQCPVLMVK